MALVATFIALPLFGSCGRPFPDMDDAIDPEVGIGSTLLQRLHRKCIRIMCRVTRHHTRKHHISTEELDSEANLKLGTAASTTSGTMFIRGCQC